MSRSNQHIIFIGFKNAGKTVIGKEVATRLKRPFIDLDKEIEKLYAEQLNEALSCREISKRHGETFFRDLEVKALQEVIHVQPSVIALGGGAPLREENRLLLKPHILIYLTASPEIVFQRIMAGGIPSFFEEEDPLGSFKSLWAQRQQVYQDLAVLTIDNSGDVQDAIQEILEKLTVICKEENQ
ncbi:MAG TPA: shikimate kinase [Gammaproteobacteria bacterium]|nr:shikimate kinase [Gammaproteobacteria bacterium]